MLKSGEEDKRGVLQNTAGAYRILQVRTEYCTCVQITARVQNTARLYKISED